MGNVIPLSDERHQQVQNLLPWYVNDTLDEDEAAAVEAHLVECEECRADLMSERALGSETALALMDVDQGWAAMRERIEAGERPPEKSDATALPLPPSAEGLVPFRRKNILSRRIPIGWALAAQAAALVLVIGGAEFARPSAEPTYHALGSTPAPAAGNVIVIFRPDATEQAMRAALAGSGTRLVDGPTASGAYVLHADAAKRADALAALRADSHIVLAEPIDGSEQP